MKQQEEWNRNISDQIKRQEEWDMKISQQISTLMKLMENKTCGLQEIG